MVLAVGDGEAIEPSLADLRMPITKGVRCKGR
jgi:hypothetical protein